MGQVAAVVSAFVQQLVDCKRVDSVCKRSSAVVLDLADAVDVAVQDSSSSGACVLELVVRALEACRVATYLVAAAMGLADIVA